MQTAPKQLEKDMKTTELEDLLATAKKIARRYYTLTGRPMGITGEMAEYEAVRLLRLSLAPVRQSGWDASGRDQSGTVVRYQIKGRCVLPTSKHGQKLGAINLKKEWDAVLLVVLNDCFDAVAIYRAEREVIEAALTRPGSRARNLRGQLSLSKFKSIGRRVWPS